MLEDGPAPNATAVMALLTLLWTLCTTPSPAAAQDPAMEKVRQSVRYWEQQLAREIDLHAKGAASERSIEDVRVTLAKVRHHLALRERNPASAREQSKLILEIRDRQAQRLAGLAGSGFATELELTEARRRAAAARFHVADDEGRAESVVEQLRLVVDQSRKEVNMLNRLRDQAVSAWELHRAENRVICAEYLLARLQGTPEDATRELRRHVDVCADEEKKVLALRVRGAALPHEVYLVRNNLLNARLRLANVEQDRDALAEHLRALIRLHEQMLAQERNLDPSLFPAQWVRHFRNALQNELERDRWRLEQLRAGDPHFDDLAAATLDS